MFLTVFPEFLFSFRQFRQIFKKVEKSVQDPKKFLDEFVFLYFLEKRHQHQYEVHVN